jgi:hypothetical protein
MGAINFIWSDIWEMFIAGHFVDVNQRLLSDIFARFFSFSYLLSINF